MRRPIDNAMPGRKAACWLTGVIVTEFLILVSVALTPQLRSLLIPCLYTIIPAGVVVFALSILFAASGRDTIPVYGLLAGWAALLSGSAADIYATLTHSPDLAREANLLLRALLDSGLSLDLVFAYGAATQFLMIGIGMTLWIAFLKHRTSFLRLMPPRGSILTYFKAGTGARELTYRQWLCPLRWEELPWGYHYACWAAVCFVYIGLARFYPAAEWYQLVSPTITNRVIAGSLLLVLLCGGYGVWLKLARQRLPESPEIPDGTSIGQVTDQNAAPQDEV
jgi:hypothetical protein